MRLGDFDALFHEFEKAAWYDNADRDEVAEPLLLDAPTIDAVTDTNVGHKWISVEERLPEGGGSVLIYSPFGGVAEGTYSEHYKRWVQYRWSVFEPEVTHWMPLPDAPEVEV